MPLVANIAAAKHVACMAVLNCIFGTAVLLIPYALPFGTRKAI
jgi:hypothetical protein